ncbi:unnamed protein product [Adineta steineri]|uniref:Uncharacterized protein n=1 Tax=Adineta steineri TaxID=433720 RepID=A0A814ZZH3_9BILA|nr:unnamed protein product [Adineta steineri]
MRRENKYGTSKTIRFCQNSFEIWSQQYSSERPSINKRNRWKLLDLLNKYAESPDFSNKIVIRRNYNFCEYDGYESRLRENPPPHPSFSRKPDFVYQPYVNFIKVNQDKFDLMFQNGCKLSEIKNNFEDLINIDAYDGPVMLIYFINDSNQYYSPDWFQALRHASGGSFAGYHTIYVGDYCSFGPKIRGQQQSDSRINQIVLILTNNDIEKRCGYYSVGYYKCLTKADQFGSVNIARSIAPNGNGPLRLRYDATSFDVPSGNRSPIKAKAKPI